MSSWVCKTCGTINDDPLDKTYNDFSVEIVKVEMERRREFENKGEIPPMYCGQCNIQRVDISTLRNNG